VVGDNKRQIIEMNHAQTLYLGSYFRIDCIDHLIQNTRIFIDLGNTGTPQSLHGRG
jgi:hypothetical protein